MASSSCWACIIRPATQFSNPILHNTRLSSLPRAFSTSSILLATPPKKKPAGSKPPPAGVKGKKFTLKKKTVVRTGRAPAPGERKAIRKRVVLSNTNALEVQWLGDLDAESFLDEELVGQVMGLKGETVDSLRAVGAFKTAQGWGLFRRPGVLVRDESLLVSRLLVDAEGERTEGERRGERESEAERERAGEGEGRELRLLVDGAKGTGKSLLLLHAMATAFVRGWVVLNIPEAQDLTNANTAYAPIPGTNPLQYVQPTYTATWLGQILKANNAILQHLELSQKHALPIPLQSNISLARLCELGARDPDIAWPVFQAFWKEITADGRPPVLLCVDSLSNIMRNSAYRSPEFELVHAHDLVLVKHLVDCISGAKKFQNGGAVIAATSRSHAPISQSMELAILQASERESGENVTPKDPFGKEYDARVDEALKNIEVLRLNGLSKLEARGLMDYWAASGVLRTTVNEKTVAEKWALAGHGVIGEMERGALIMRI